MKKRLWFCRYKNNVITSLFAKMAEQQGSKFTKPPKNIACSNHNYVSEIDFINSQYYDQGESSICNLCFILGYIFGGMNLFTIY